jgi:hypothetical protein
MKNKRVDLTGPERAPSTKPELGAPKPLTLRQQISFGVKLAVVGGIIFVLLWLFEKASLS